MAIEWTQSLAVGIPEIDAQHQEIFRMADQMVDAMKHGQGRQELGKLVEFLGRYTVEHFACEEKRMLAARYPGTAAHIAEHKAFLKDFVAISDTLGASTATSLTVLSAHRAVCDWVRNHIEKSDQAFGRYLADEQRGRAA